MENRLFNGVLSLMGLSKDFYAKKFFQRIPRDKKTFKRTYLDRILSKDI